MFDKESGGDRQQAFSEEKAAFMLSSLHHEDSSAMVQHQQLRHLPSSLSSGSSNSETVTECWHHLSPPPDTSFAGDKNNDDFDDATLCGMDEQIVVLHCPEQRENGLSNELSVAKIRIAASITGRPLKIQHEDVEQLLAEHPGGQWAEGDDGKVQHFILLKADKALKVNTIIKALVAESPFTPKSLDAYVRCESLLQWAVKEELADLVKPEESSKPRAFYLRDKAIDYIQETLTEADGRALPTRPSVCTRITNIIFNNYCCPIFSCIFSNNTNNNVQQQQRDAQLAETPPCNGPSSYLVNDSAPCVADLLLCMELIPAYGYIRANRDRWRRVTEWLDKMLHENIGYKAGGCRLGAVFPRKEVSILSKLPPDIQQKIKNPEPLRQQHQSLAVYDYADSVMVEHGTSSSQQRHGAGVSTNQSLEMFGVSSSTPPDIQQKISAQYQRRRGTGMTTTWLTSGSSRQRQPYNTRANAASASQQRESVDPTLNETIV